MSSTNMHGLNLSKIKKAKTVLHGFIEIVNKSKHKSNKLWVDAGREFYNNLIQKWLDNNYILMYSTHNEVKPIVAERFIRTLKGKIYKKGTVNDSKSYLTYLNKTVDKYNIYQFSIGKKPNDADYFALSKRTETNPKPP